MPTPPEPVPPAVAVGTLLAPVVACLRGDDEGLGVLVGGACDDGVAAAAVRAAPAVARVYLRLAPPPDGAGQILGGYLDAARRRFADPEVVKVGAECLQVARVEAAPLAPIAEAVFADLAFEHGERCALEGAIASCWWCARRSAEMRGNDPVEEAAAICRYLARVA
ncbi:MAG: hypothetical protein KatS3mg009_2823 [Acidimicrobiia bacterium]|nr:MAG: hypothetical protein KatS3mg009_2823 [Acidimicrobiia bacterium]